MREQLQLFHASSLLMQLQTALSHPDVYNGDPADLYRSTALSLEPLGVPLPEMATLKETPEATIDSVRLRLQIRFPDLVAFIRLGKITTGFALTSYHASDPRLTPLLDGMEFEIRRLLLKHGASRNRVDSWLDSCRTNSNRTEVMENLMEIMNSLGTVDTAADTSSQVGNKVFVVHGHDQAIKEKVARFLERLNLQPIILHEQPNRGRGILEKFTDYADVAYAVVLLTADDIGGTKGTAQKSLTSRARQNVIFELGYFIARIGRDRVCALMEPGVEMPSDYNGILYLSLDPHDAWRLQLASELKASGLTVDVNDAV